MAAVDYEMAEAVEININLGEEKDRASVPVTYAYHVTNVKVEFNDKYEPINRPNWRELLWQLADDPIFDGKYLLGAPCVFFTTTLRNKEIPRTTMYPRGGKLGETYWRVKVPLTHFDDYTIIFVNHCKSQVRLLLLNEEDASNIPQNILTEKNADRYLHREKREDLTVQYYSNDYADQSTRYFVNLAVCDDVDISEDDIVWDTVERNMERPGVPSRKELKQRLVQSVVVQSFIS